MRAVLVEDGKLVLREDYPVPKALPHEALVRVTLAGICSTDLEILKGYVPGFRGVLGHEFCGVVEEAPDRKWIGKRVCSGINMIDPAKVAPENCCCCLEHHPERTVLGIINKDGCFADYVTVPVANLVEIPNGVPDQMAVFTEPLAAAIRIRDQICVKPTASIAVMGAGKLGLLVGKVLQAAGNDVCMLCRSDTSFAVPKKWGLEVDFTKTAKDDSFDLVVEATGNIEGFREALRLVRPMGTIVLKSTYAGAPSIDLTKVVVGEITIVGSRCGPFPAAMRMLSRQEIPVTDLISETFHIKSATEAFAKAKERGVRKILIKTS